MKTSPLVLHEREMGSGIYSLLLWSIAIVNWIEKYLLIANYF